MVIIGPYGSPSATALCYAHLSFGANRRRSRIPARSSNRSAVRIRVTARLPEIGERLREPERENTLAWSRPHGRVVEIFGKSGGAEPVHAMRSVVRRLAPCVHPFAPACRGTNRSCTPVCTGIKRTDFATPRLPDSSLSSPFRGMNSAEPVSEVTSRVVTRQNG